MLPCCARWAWASCTARGRARRGGNRNRRPWETRALTRSPGASARAVWRPVTVCAWRKQSGAGLDVGAQGRCRWSICPLAGRAISLHAGGRACGRHMDRSLNASPLSSPPTAFTVRLRARSARILGDAPKTFSETPEKASPCPPARAVVPMPEGAMRRVKARSLLPCGRSGSGWSRDLFFGWKGRCSFCL